MSKSLDEMRDILGKSFDFAVKNLNSISDYESNSLERAKARAAALDSIAKITDSITMLEAQATFQKLLEQAEKDGSRIVIEVSQGIAKDMKLPGAIKLKQPGTP